VSNDKKKIGRRKFLCTTGTVLGGLGIVASGGSLLGKGTKETDAAALGDAATTSFPTAEYDWTKYRWAFGIDINKCIGCLRCVEACKAENDVVGDAHHFRTWVERYVYLEGEDKVRVDSHADPQNIAASGSEAEYRFDNRYKDAKVSKAFFVPKLCNHCANPPCVQVCPVGATFRAEDGAVLVDRDYCIGCKYCIQACPYGARYFNAELYVADKCTWCYHRISKGLLPACVEACPTNARIFGNLNDSSSLISEFIRDNAVQVLKPESGTAPMCFYVGMDKDVT